MAKPKSVKNPEGLRFIEDIEAYNLTHLSPLKELARGRMIHRDFNAHVFRWQYAAKEVFKLGDKRADATVLDIACGPDWPLFTVMHSNGCAPGYFMGVDLRDCSTTMPESKHTQMRFYPVDVTKALPSQFNAEVTTTVDNQEVKSVVLKDWNYIVCFEVLEHMPKPKGLQLLDAIQAIMAPGTELIFSTPVFDEKVGMADNHIYEWGYEELKEELEKRFTLSNHYGTFASLKDYTPLMDAAELKLLAKLKEYYNSAIVSNIMAPLYPQKARNVLWHLKKK